MCPAAHDSGGPGGPRELLRLCGARGDQCAPSTDRAVPLPQSSVGAAAAALRATWQQEGALIFSSASSDYLSAGGFEDGHH